MEKKEQAETMDILEINVLVFFHDLFLFGGICQRERDVTSIKGDFLICDIDNARGMKNFYEA